MYVDLFPNRILGEACAVFDTRVRVHNFLVVQEIIFSLLVPVDHACQLERQSKLSSPTKLFSPIRERLVLLRDARNQTVGTSLETSRVPSHIQLLLLALPVVKNVLRPLSSLERDEKEVEWI